MIKIHLLGSLQLFDNNQELSLPASIHARKLLVNLLLFPARQHSRNTLIGIFWPDQSEDRARKALSQAIWHIRKTIPDLIISDGELIRLSSNIEYSIDTLTFEQLTQPWTDITPLPSEGKAALLQAINLYQGELLEGYYDDWVLLERERFRNLFQQILEQLLQAEKTAENYTQALEFGLRLLQLDPLRENIHRELMRLYYSRTALKQLYNNMNPAVRYYKPN